MDKIVKSDLFGVFEFNSDYMAYEHNGRKIKWILKLEKERDDVNNLMLKAEKLFTDVGVFDKIAKRSIAVKLIDFKNDFWPEYDENDEELDWDAVDAGEYDVTIEKFEGLISLHFIEVRSNYIYCEYYDGDLFGGHRIHASFDYNYNLIHAEL